MEDLKILIARSLLALILDWLVDRDIKRAAQSRINHIPPIREPSCMHVAMVQVFTLHLFIATQGNPYLWELVYFIYSSCSDNNIAGFHRQHFSVIVIMLLYIKFCTTSSRTS